MRQSAIVILIAGVATTIGAQGPAPKASPPPSPRLYVLDCGMLTMSAEGVARYHVTAAETGETRMPVPCYLVAHPKGTLMWDVGVIPDDTVEQAGAAGARYDVNPTAAALVRRTLRGQLAAIGYRPADITYVAVSHAHKDHTANLNQFAAVHLAHAAGRARVHVEAGQRARRAALLLRARAQQVDAIETDEHDVFGDGTVVIKAAPGHTPGHQVLVLRLAATGRVMIAGDLYHYRPSASSSARRPTTSST